MGSCHSCHSCHCCHCCHSCHCCHCCRYPFLSLRLSLTVPLALHDDQPLCKHTGTHGRILLQWIQESLQQEKLWISHSWSWRCTGQVRLHVPNGLVHIRLRRD